MAEANRRVERGEFAEAAQQYEALIGLGYRDTAVYYNLGNAYLEDGDLGRAVLNYLRAEELSPRDPDVIANLAPGPQSDGGPTSGRGGLTGRQCGGLWAAVGHGH